MTNAIHVQAAVIAKHRAYPLSEEREAFLRHRAALGSDRSNVRSLAASLLQVVHFLKLEKPRKVTLSEIDEAGDLWAQDTEQHSHKKGGKYSKQVFVTGARLFLRFHGLLDLQFAPQAFGRELVQYLQVIREQRGLATSTIESRRGHLIHFLDWVAKRRESLSEVVATDVLDYLDFKRCTCCSRSVIAAAQPLRSFFAYGESQGWCTANLREILKFPKRRRYDPDIVFPSWSDVRRILDENVGNKPVDLRNRAMLLLCAIYGLRSTEVIRLRFKDFDWEEQTLTVTRSKNGRTQQFPLQWEVGEAILKYLFHGRPRSHCRNLFVSQHVPHRRVSSTVINHITVRRMDLLQVASSKRGPHALRHACATELLRTGSSLKDIADFLGHKDLTTVSVYARSDLESLREVAAISLRGVL